MEKSNKQSDHSHELLGVTFACHFLVILSALLTSDGRLSIVRAPALLIEPIAVIYLVFHLMNGTPAGMALGLIKKLNFLVVIVLAILWVIDLAFSKA